MRNIFIGCVSAGLSFAAMADVQYDASIPQVEFAAKKVQQVVGDKPVKIVFKVSTDVGDTESFRIERPSDQEIVVIGSDAAGAMYGGLEVAEELRIGGPAAVQADYQKPAMGMRGIKFNIPLDVRTPSYTDLGDAGQFNIPHMWDFGFWREFIDEMACDRYNYLSLWNLHPFPSLVKVPEYPDVALDDVKRAVGLERKYYNGRGQDFDAPEILDETETLIKMTVDEKIAFWRKVMAYGKSRNVDLYFVTWNIFDYGTKGKYGIDDKINNKTTQDYFRQSVKALFLTYPDLKGIGITTGENMPGASSQDKEDWVWETYGKGIMDVVKEQPDRRITFLHRQHQAGANEIAETFKPLIDHPNVEFLFSFKYAKAHVYSSTTQTYHDKFVRDLEAHGDLKTIWTMRNDSTYLFRWAAPDFLREFVGNIPKDVNRGYYFGSDGWIWGRDYICTTGPQQGELELKRHWLQWLLWGRFAYQPDLGNERISGIVQARFPEADGAQLLEAWQAASMLYPLVTGFHWGPLDFHWYPEACVGVKGSARKGGFNDVESFIKLNPHPGTDFIDIKTFAAAVKSGQGKKGTTPYEVAGQLLQNADKALEIIGGIKAKPGTELAETLKDIEAMAWLGRYYAHKIVGATELQLFREMNNKANQDKAIQSLERAAACWRQYVDNLTGRYRNDQWLARIRSGPIDWQELTRWVDEDIEIAKKER